MSIYYLRVSTLAVKYTSHSTKNNISIDRCVHRKTNHQFDQTCPPPAARCYRTIKLRLATQYRICSLHDFLQLLMLLLRIMECVPPCRSTGRPDEIPSILGTAEANPRLPHARSYHCYRQQEARAYYPARLCPTKPPPW